MKFYTQEEVLQQLALAAFADRDRQTDEKGLPREETLYFTPDGQYFLGDADGHSAAHNHATHTGYFPEEFRLVYVINRPTTRRAPQTNPDGSIKLTQKSARELGKLLGLDLKGTADEDRAALTAALTERGIEPKQPAEAIAEAIAKATQAPTA